MGDSKRFVEFARLISKQFPLVKTIADIAGGRGDLQVSLRKHGYDVTTFDKNNHWSMRPDFKYINDHFTHKTKGKWDLLVGLHCDGASDVIIQEAAKRKCEFAIVPCCIIPTVTTFESNGHCPHCDWNDHLASFANSLGFSILRLTLPIQGKKLVLVGRLENTNKRRR